MSALFVATVLLYAGATAGYMVHLRRGLGLRARYVHGALGLAAVAHLVLVVVTARARQASPLGDLPGIFTVLGLGTTLAFLFATLRVRIEALGAFVAPLTLFFLVLAGVSHNVADVSQQVRTALLPVHIGVTMLGLVAFGLAFGASTAYLVQDGNLRRKELTGVFRRLPPLDVLDTVSSGALAIGFPLFTAGIVIGALFVARGSGFFLGPAQFVGLVTWAVFASVVYLRVMAGWRGRRAALGTMLGFACAMVVLAIYAARAGAT